MTCEVIKDVLAANVTWQAQVRLTSRSEHKRAGVTCASGCEWWMAAQLHGFDQGFRSFRHGFRVRTLSFSFFLSDVLL